MTTTSALDGTAFPPIADYSFLSNCEVSALVAADGSVEWMCLPRPDSPSVFGALLDRAAGSFRFSPSNARVPAQRRYIPGTMMVETTWHTPTGWVTTTDLLVVGPTDPSKRLPNYRRAPGDSAPRGTLLRMATCTSGRVEMEVNCLPLFDYGLTAGEWDYDGEGYGRCVARSEDDLALHLVSTMELEFMLARCGGRTSLAEGDSMFVALTWRDDAPATLEEAQEQCHQTQSYWRNWLSKGQFPDHRFRPYIERSVLALKGLSYAPTGAIMAASTTSLPETPGGERNWDYRYTWIRDSAFMLRALHDLGFDWEAFEFFAFVLSSVMEATDPETFSLQIMYGIGGETDLRERTLDHLTGYLNSKPVRVGNGAYDQKQHDVWGMLLDSVVTHLRSEGQMAPKAWAGLAGLVDTAIAESEKPDQGIWEMRGPPQHFVASKVMCWIAADRGAHLARARADHERAERWQKAADAIKADVLAHGVDDRGVFAQAYGSKDLDAANLLIPLMGFLPPDDERVRATVLAIADELTSEGLVLRYRLDTADDGLSSTAEGSFTICSFWLVSALAMIGETDRARKLFEKLLSFAGPLQLYAEEIDPETGLHLGNYPQAFTHLALIHAALQLVAAEPK
jgi:GH15 family glucan-1,4-alpha-glucosidase